MWFACAALAAHAADSFSGSVKAVEGACTIQRGSQTIPATEGMHLQEHDDLLTGPDGRLAVILHDGTRLSLGPGSKLSILQFTYNPADKQYALFLELARGLFAYVSGKIGSLSPDAVKIQTPVGNIGTRGTRFVVGIGISGGAK